jgi:hypothetical protein
LLGVREWVRAHKHELDPQRTIFLNLDEAGYGTPRYVTSEASGDGGRPDKPKLIDLCAEIREEDREGRLGAEPMLQLALADAAVAAREGYRAVRIACLPAPTFAPEYHLPTDTPDRLEPDAVERAIEFCSRLIERIDQRLGPDESRAPRA